MFTSKKEVKKIIVQFDGPYRVEGGIPLVHKTQVVSEYGEPLAWKKDEDIPQAGNYTLCRCGHSKIKPYCDNTHLDFDFDGTETADTSTTAERQVILPGGTGISVKKDDSLCMDSGFCANRFRDVDEMLADSDDTDVRSQIMAMIERCPSGTYVYSIEEGGPEIEPDLPQQVAATTEITSAGPIEGPLWVTGNIPIERADGKPFETRNRVTLCSCGESNIKPLCDGTHRHMHEQG
jgi:CDGSH-type Zn-finger protein